MKKFNVIFTNLLKNYKASYRIPVYRNEKSKQEIRFFSSVEMKKKIFQKFIIGVITVLFSVSIINAQITIPPDKEQLLKGDPMGIHLIAEQNGYVHLQKVLELKEQLNLTKDQLRKIDELVKNYPISVNVKSEEIIEAEEGLNKLFETENISDKILRSKLEQIGKLRADLKFLHLQMYTKTKQILTEKQWVKLKEITSNEVK